MSHALIVRTYHIVVDAPAEAVFDYIMDLGNLSRWSIHWCKDVRLVPDGAIVTTANGDLYFGITGDRDSGILDWWAGPTMETAQRWPTRVVGLPDGQTLYLVTALLADTAPPNIDQWFNDELAMLKQQVEALLVPA